MLLTSRAGFSSLLAATNPSSQPGSGWLYDLLTKFGVSSGTAKNVTDLIVRPVEIAIVVIVAALVARYGGKVIRRILTRLADQAALRSGSTRAGARVNTMSGLAANIWRFFIAIIAIATVLGMLGLNLTPLLASATIIGATIGFGAQQLIRDYLSGFLLTVEDQFSIGDSVTIGAVTGTVEDVTMRVTRVRSIDGTLYFIANGDIRLLANTSRGWSRATVDLVLAATAAADLTGVQQIVTEAAHRVAERPEFQGHASEGAKLVGMVGADATTMTLRVTLHTVPSQRDAIARALREECVSALAAAGHLLPTPT